MQTYVVDLNSAENFTGIISAFNAGLIVPSGGEWNGNSWDAFHDYLSWPQEENYQLVLVGWASCKALSDEARTMLQSIFKDNIHVAVRFA
jgi:hypothetical protein